MITVAGKAAGCVNPDDTYSKTVSVLGLHLAAGLPAPLPDQLRHHPAARSCCRSSVAFVDRSSRKKWHMARLWVRRLALRGAAVLHAGRPAGSSARVAVVLASILGASSLVADYAILVDIATGTSATDASSRGWAFGYLGGGLPLRSSWGWCSGTTRSASARGWPCGSRCSPRRLWWAGVHDDPAVAAAQHAAGQPGRRGGLRCSSAASASCSRRCATCAATR